MAGPTCVDSTSRATIKANLQKAASLSSGIISIIDRPDIIGGDKSYYQKINAQATTELAIFDTIPNCR